MPVLFDRGVWKATLAGPTPSDPVEATAYKAIRRNLEALTSLEVPAERTGLLPIYLGARARSRDPSFIEGLSAHGFRIRIDDRAIAVAGGSPKGTLNGAYGLLERLGLRFPQAPLDRYDGRAVDRIELPNFDETEEPSHPGITLFQDVRTLRDYSDPDPAGAQAQNDADLLRWMGRHRFTGLYGNLPEPQEIWRGIGRLGIGRQAGGHVLPRFLPRDLLDEHPDYFPMDASGQRFAGNLCVSNADAVRVVCDQAEAYVRETGAEVLHLWGEDVLSGRWCACPQCAGSTPQDQCLMIANAVAERFASALPGVRIGFIAYHDTLTPNLTLSPHDGVICLFAPRQRCYRHSLADPSCARNAEILAGLHEYRRIFGEKRLHTFEYYGDALLWCSAAIALPRMIVDDVRAYYDVGVVDSGCLMFGGFTWFSTPINLYTFARVSWRIDRSADEIIDEYVSRVLPGAGRAAIAYIDALEQASRMLAERTDWFYRVPTETTLAVDLTDSALEAEKAWEALSDRLGEAIAAARPEAGDQLLRLRQSLRLSQHLVRAYRSRIDAVSQSSDPAAERAALLRARSEILAGLRLLHDLPPHRRGSWGASGHGEPRRLAQLLAETIEPRLRSLGA